MIISDSSNLIFIHIPKTGGTTVTNYFRRLVPRPRIFWGGTDAFDHAHIGCGDITNFVSMESLLGYTWFSVARNPYDRAYSAYLHLTSGRKPVVNTNITFRQFLEALEKDQNAWGVHARPMTHFCTACDVKVHNIRILHTETFDQDFHTLLLEFKLPTRYRNHNINNCHFKNPFRYKEVYDHDTLLYELVNRIAEEDFDTFGYEKIAPSVRLTSPEPDAS